MKVVLPGGSGFVGTILARSFVRRGYEVAVLSRRPRPAPWPVVAWDGVTLGPWTREIDGADVVINLAGRSVNCRYNATNRRDILDSRVRSTRVVGEAIARASRPPRVWLQASTATIYAHRYDAPNDEVTGVIGGAEPGAPSSWHFSIDVAQAWEAALAEAKVSGTRRVAMRSAIVMSPEPGGVFPVLRRHAALGFGGGDAGGRQFISWVHERDFVRAIDWLIAHDLEGPVNVASPFPIPNVEFMRELQREIGAPVAASLPAWVLEIGARLIHTESELILKSRRVVPTRLLRSGFVFHFAHWEDAVRDLCHRWTRRGAGLAA